MSITPCWILEGLSILINYTHLPVKSVSGITVFLVLWAGCIFNPTASDDQNPGTISVSSSLVYLGFGDTAVITAEVLDQAGWPIADAPLSWSSRDPDVVSVDNQGVLTALSFGTTAITVTSGTVSTVILVTVSKERALLVAFFNAMNGPTWVNKKNWLSTHPLSAWHGVTVNSSDRVERLNLEKNGLKGELPSVLGELAELKSLKLSDNSIDGNIPGSIGDLRNLDTLSIVQSGLRGEIPTSLGNLTNLEHLYLYENQLSGAIPSTLGNLVKLEQLSLFKNNFSGEIPASLGRLASLVDMDLSVNSLTGSIPPELAGMSGLKYLDLRFNFLTGNIPPDFGDFSVLESLWLANNGLSGSIPPEIGHLNRLRLLDLSHNSQLMGPLPLDLTNLNSLSSLSLTGTGLCAPTDPDFQEWLEMVDEGGGLEGVSFCTGI